MSFLVFLEQLRHERRGPLLQRDPHPQLAHRAPRGKSLFQLRERTCARLHPHRLAPHLYRRPPFKVAMAAEDTQFNSSVHADVPEGHKKDKRPAREN